METNRAIFVNNLLDYINTGNRASITGTKTQESGDQYLYSREIIEDAGSIDERALYLKTSDDDAASVTVAVDISLFNGEGWMAWTNIKTAVAAGSEIIVTSYGKEWWVKNSGVKFRFTVVGTGAVTYSEARWI